MIGTTARLLAFFLEGSRFGIALDAIQSVARAVEITPLPKAPEIVLGVINVRGQVVPVINLRRRFRLPERDIGLNDHLVIGRTSRRSLALVADAVHGIVECAAEDIVAPQAIVPGLEYVEGIVKLADGLIVIHDLDTFLALDEEACLQEAMDDA